MKKHTAWSNLRYIMDCLKEYNGHIFLLMAAYALMEAVIPLLSVYLPKWYLSMILSGCEISYVLVRMGASLGTVLLLLFTEKWIRSGCRANMQAARNGYFGDRLSKKMYSIRYAYLEDPKVQELYFRSNFLFWDERSGMMGVCDCLQQMLSAALMIALLAVSLCHFHLLIPLFLIAEAAAEFLILKKAKENEQSLRERRQNILREKEYTEEVCRTPEYGKDIRVFGLYPLIGSHYEKLNAQRQQIDKKTAKWYRWASGMDLWISLAGRGCVFALAVWAAARKNLTADDILLLFAAVTSFSSAVSLILNKGDSVLVFLKNTDDYRNMMEMEEWKEKASCEIAAGIRFSDVSFRYGDDKTILEDVSFTVDPGKKTAIVGMNGAGKSTLIKLMCGLYQPESGKIDALDAEGKPIESEALTTSCGVVFQKIFQYAFTIGENITFSPEPANKERMKKALAESGVLEFMEEGGLSLETGLGAEFDASNVNLSGGQLQVLALAREIYRDAPIIILDEPTAAMDSIAEEKLYRKFLTTLKDKTCVYVSHRMSSVRFCDKVILVDGGRIAAEGSHAELMQSSELYRTMWEAQRTLYQEEVQA